MDPCSGIRCYSNFSKFKKNHLFGVVKTIFREVNVLFYLNIIYLEPLIFNIIIKKEKIKENGIVSVRLLSSQKLPLTRNFQKSVYVRAHTQLELLYILRQ